MKGEKNINAKLPDSAILSIRESYFSRRRKLKRIESAIKKLKGIKVETSRKNSLKYLGNLYGVSAHHIGRIVRGEQRDDSRTWWN